MDPPVPNVGEVHGRLLALQKNLECPICLDVMKEPVSTNCAHIFCRFCILKLLKQKTGVAHCPLCNAKVTKRSLRDNICLKEVIKGILDIIHAFERDTGLKFSDDLDYPKKGIEAVSASSTCKEQLIINSKGYRNRSKYMKNEEKRNTESRDVPILPQYYGNETRNFLRKIRNSSKTVVLEMDKNRSVSSENAFQEENVFSCMDFESPSPSQVDKDHIMTQNQSSSHIGHPEPTAKNEASLNIGICGALEGRKLGIKDDTKAINENLEIVEGNVTSKQQQDVSLLDSCMEQPGFSYLQDNRSSSFCTTTQVLLAEEAMNMSRNEQIDNGEKTLIDQSAGNLSVVYENKECQLQSQTLPDICLSESSGGERIQSMNKVNEWFSESREILSTSPLVIACSEELLQDPDSSDSEISQPVRKVKGTRTLDLDNFVQRQNVKLSNKESVRKREDPVLENSDQAFAVKKSPAEQPEAASSKIACVEEAASMLKGDGDKQTQSERHMLPELNLTHKETCMEQPGFSYLQDDRSSSFCTTTQVQLAGEAMNMSRNEQIDNGEKTLIDQSAGNLSVVCENKECQLQSQTTPDICLSESSGGERIQSTNKVSEWFSESREILSTSPLVACSEELLQDPDSSDSEISQPMRKVKGTRTLDLDNFVQRQNVKLSNKESVRKREDPVLENSDQAFAVVKKSPAEQPEAASSKIACVEEAASMLKGDGDKEAQSECHMLPELNLTHKETKSNYLNKKSKLTKPLDKLQVLNKSPVLSEESKEELDIKDPRKVSQDQMEARWKKELQWFTEESRRQSEPTKRKRKVDEREAKLSIPPSERMSSYSVTEDNPCVMQDNLKKANSHSNTSMIDKPHLCDVDMACANHENFPPVIGAAKDTLNTEETAKSHGADSQDRSSLLQSHPGKVEQAVSKEVPVLVNQLEKYAMCPETIQNDGICTDNGKSPETNKKARGSCELTLETDESELDTGFMQNVFACCKRRSFLVGPSLVKELALDIKYLQGLSPDKRDKDGTHEEKCDVVSCEENESTSVQTPTFPTSNFSEHKKLALPDPFPGCPPISLQSVTRSEEDGCQPESRKTMDEQRQSPGLEKTESPDDCTGSLNVRKNSNLHDSAVSHINSSSSGSVYFQDAESKDIENENMELSPQAELTQQPSLTSLPLLLGFIHAEKEGLMEEKLLNGDTEKAVGVSSPGEMKSVIPQPNLECSAKEYQHFELLSETPDNLLDPPTKKIKGSPDLWDTDDILTMAAKINKRATNGRDLGSKNKRSPMLKSQGFDLTYQKLQQRLPSSEEDYSEDEKLPCFQELINMQSTQSHSVKEKEIPVEVLTSSSGSGFKSKKVDTCQSQESELSVNLFSSQSNVSMASGKACNSKDLIPFSNSKEKLPSLSGDNNKGISPCDKGSIDDKQRKREQEEHAHLESNLGEEMMPYATPPEDSLGQFSQSEILTTQQRDAMQKNLKQLQQKMAIIEAVLKEGSQSVDPEGWPLEREEADFKREQRETRKEMHTVLEKPVSSLARTPCRSTKQRSRKRLLLTGGQKMSLVASGLNQSELKLVRKFAKKTESTWCNKITEKTTHVIMKTDEDLVCERTLKYFTGVAAQKWVLSYQWIIDSFKAGRVLKEEDFEVRGDVINGRNHQGPKRARESPVGKLLQGFEICCYGPFTDMLPEQLEWIVELCGASLVKQPHLFARATNSTAVIVVQPDAWTEESTCQEFPQQCSIPVVSREWVLDSVACYQCQPFKDYIFPQKKRKIPAGSNVGQSPGSKVYTSKLLNSNTGIHYRGTSLSPEYDVKTHRETYPVNGLQHKSKSSED